MRRSAHVTLVVEGRDEGVLFFRSKQGSSCKKRYRPKTLPFSGERGLIVSFVRSTFPNINRYLKGKSRLHLSLHHLSAPSSLSNAQKILSKSPDASRSDTRLESPQSPPPGGKRRSSLMDISIFIDLRPCKQEQRQERKVKRGKLKSTDLLRYRLGLVHPGEGAISPVLIAPFACRCAS